jgi:hypothetical protein
MKRSERLTLVLLLCGISFIFFTAGTAATASRMKRESLAGYVAEATYSTNEFGEVSIKTLVWEKK